MSDTTVDANTKAQPMRAFSGSLTIRAWLACGLLLLCGFGHHACATSIRAAGSSFPAPLYAAWGGIYEKQTGVRIEYDAGGTTKGIEALAKGSVSFVAANRPQSESKVDAQKLIQFPVVMGGTVVVVNLSGVGPGELRLTGPLVADIFRGKVNRWTDPAIRKLNPTLRLPPSPINVISRKDPSGTTFLLSSFLDRVSPEWRAEVSNGPYVKFPVGFKGEGMTNLMDTFNRVPNSITYVDYAYAKRVKLSFALIQNQAGQFVSPNYRSLQAATLGVKWTGALSIITTNSPHPEAWPIASPSFVLMRTSFATNDESANAQHAVNFLDWAMRLGDQIADDLDFVPLPLDVKQQVERAVSARLRKLDNGD